MINKNVTTDFSNYEVGVIVGRFQVHDLHQAHCEIIDTVTARHKKVILFLGVAPTLGGFYNPLDFPSRKMMLQEKYPDIVILSLPDQREDEPWSKTLDSRIREVFKTGKVLLYGGRDSFIPHYRGIYNVTELETDIFVSGTEIRKRVSEEIKSSSLWRAGVIFQTYNRYPVSFQTVDIVALNHDETKILMAKKPGENQYRFIGGFVDPSDPSLESAAAREFKEETGGADIDNLKYIGSFRIDDWRYRRERDKIMTAFFIGTFTTGYLTPSDDISELRWIDRSTFMNKEFHSTEIVNEHRPLALSLFSYLNAKK